MKEREFAKIHVDVVSERLREYEEVLASKEFKALSRCDVCGNAPYITSEGYSNSGCNGCLFFYENEQNRQFSCIPEKPGDPLSGSSCWNKKQQRVRFKRLLRRLEQNGWTFE